ncbi:MAG: CBS domain-containing protein [Pirellulales bacterium]
MVLREILREKGAAVHSIGPDATLDNVVQKLVEFNCGSLVVCREDRMVGIITERDILRFCAARRMPLDACRVEGTMTGDVVTGKPGDSVEHTMGLMTEKRIRHLPILEDGRLCGLISIGDVVKAQHRIMAIENQYLKTYIQS